MDLKLKNTENLKIIIPAQQNKKRRLQVGDPDFVPPDGGWGWLIVLACGFSNLSTFPMIQQFGLVFRTKFEELHITSAQTTSVINIHSAFTACIGLLNGPVFRKFTFRQVAICGSLLVATSLFFTQFCDSFWGYIILYSACYGAGIGITQSANALALNTYFKQKRRLATSFSWSTTALGPIVWPYIIVALNSFYGMEGTLLIFSGFALHALVGSLLLQPVEWHTKFRETNPESVALLENEHPENKANCEPTNLRKKSLFSSQYLHNEDDPLHAGYEITDPGTPMMSKYNDGWFSRSQVDSELPLPSNKSKTADQEPKPISTASSNTLVEHGRDRSGSQVKRKMSQINTPTIVEEGEYDIKNEEPAYNELTTPPRENKTLKNDILVEHKEQNLETKQDNSKYSEKELESQEPKKITIWKKISIFFGFELFKDLVYVNLMLGLTVANFAEINFSTLTPMVLKEFNFGEYQTATFMSLLAATDIVVRFFIPFITEKIGWENKTFFLVGVLAMALGRIILVHTQTYVWGLVVAVIIGAGKGLRTIFIALVIPSYVPLEKLPAASGLQLAISGIFFIVLGPVVGWVRDAVNNYVVTLHLLNICTYATTVAWITEDIFSRKKQDKNSKKSETNNSSNH